jgi:hypothetical protein
MRHGVVEDGGEDAAVGNSIEALLAGAGNEAASNYISVAPE